MAAPILEPGLLKRRAAAMAKQRGKEIVGLVESPAITDTGAVARMVEYSDGSGEVQTYVSGRGWHPGIVKVYSLMVAFEDATEENLAKKGYTAEQIAEVLTDPSTAP